MKIIDADKLLEKLRECNHIVMTSPMFDINLILNELPSVTSWIPVSERLPREFEKVLLSIKNTDEERIVEAGFYNSIGKYWEIDIEVAVPVLRKGEIVEAWQPLPEPWEGGGK